MIRINGVGVFWAEKWIEKVFDKLIFGEEILTVLYVYAWSTNRSEQQLERCYDTLQHVIAELQSNEIVIPCGDWNRRVGNMAAGYAGIHGGFGFGERNAKTMKGF